MNLLQILVKNAICPKLIRRGRHIILIEVPELGIRFVSSHNYLKGNEYDLAEQFDVPYTKDYFPEKCISQSFYDYNGNLPTVEFFKNFDYTSNEYLELLNFIKANEQKPWNFQQRLFFHFDEKLKILVKCIACFLKQCFSFQFELKKQLKNVRLKT